MEISKAQEYLVRRISPSEKYQDLIQFPRYLEIETVNACNARCPMCTINDWQRDTPTMKDELFEKIAAEVIDNADELRRVSLYRDGEPLLDKKLADRVAVLKDGGVKKISISTNVSLLDNKKSEDLLHAGLDMIIMSIDSLQKEVFEKIRVRLTFEEVLDNALNFIEKRNKIRPETRIWVRMILQDDNMNEWQTYEDFWSDRLSELDRIYYHNLFNWGGQLNNYTPVDKSFEPNLPCVALWSLLVIFANGDVPLCNVDYNNKYPTGSIMTNSIKELWQSKIAHQRRLLHLNDQKSHISLCENCNVWDEPPDLEGISSQYATAVEVQMS